MNKNQIVGDALILTVSDQIEQLEYLLENLPNVCFHIAATVQFSEKSEHLSLITMFVSLRFQTIYN